MKSKAEQLAEERYPDFEFSGVMGPVSRQRSQAIVDMKRAAFIAGYEYLGNELLNILIENQQAQIAGYYNQDKTEEERKIRNAVIEEYRDLILILKSKLPPKTK
jgi:hypothetical protein